LLRGHVPEPRVHHGAANGAVHRPESRGRRPEAKGKRLPDYLRAHEVRPPLAALTPKWNPLFATALYTGMRKGELFALQKSDVDFTAGLILVSRSHARDIPKGGRVEAIPINSELTPYLEKATAASLSELVFPDERGQMLPKHIAMEEVLRRAMRRAGIVPGYVEKCRRKGCGHHEPALDSNPRRCPVCQFKLWLVGEVRKLRFHHLRHHADLPIMPIDASRHPLGGMAGQQSRVPACFALSA
jgi:Phage integrase family